MVNLTDDEHQRLCDMAKRAESAEARAADAEVRAKSWHDSAMTLADQRDAAYKRNAELEAQRDTAWSELREIRRLIEADKNESTIDEVMRKVYRLSKDAHEAEQQRDELARRLAEIKSILAGGRTVGGDIEQAYRDAEEIAEDGAESYKAMTP